MTETRLLSTRRTFLAGFGAAGAFAAVPALARSGEDFSLVDLRGAIDAGAHGISGKTGGDRSQALLDLIRDAAARGAPVFLPPGTYRVSNLDLPDGAHLTGVPGATRLEYGGDGFLLAAHDAARITIENIIIDGANRRLGDGASALVQMRSVGQVNIENCEIAGSRKFAIALERCGGNVSRNAVSGAGQSAIHAVESLGLSIIGNRIADCANGGILVHRWQIGEDGTIVSGNRIERIGAVDGGTGQNGNGINVFRAGNVSVTDNTITDCAFSAIRANSATNVMIANNQCHRSGETAIYVEFAFEGAVVSGNIIQGAANGISIANFNEGGRLCSVTGNVVRDITAKGPYPATGPGFGWGIAVEADTAVSGNTVENVSKWGMLLGWGPYLRNVSISGNIVRKAPTGIAVSVVKGAGPALISGNMFDGSPRGAIVGHRWTEPVTRDLSAGGAGRYGHLTIERNLVS